MLKFSELVKFASQKNFEDTWRGERSRQKEENAWKKEAKEREKQERVELVSKGLEDNIYGIAQVGESLATLELRMD